MVLFNIALLQLNPQGNPGANLEKGITYCRLAKDMGCELALFPEMWNTGYEFLSEDLNVMYDKAVDAESVFVRAFQEEAKNLDMAIAVTYLEKSLGLPRNTVSVIDRFGNVILTYAKVHTCDFDKEKYLSPGDDFYTADLNTAAGDIKIGAMICFDREFPESARILMLKGAEIILVPNACPMDINRKSQLRSRAFENMLGIAMANYPAEKADCNGHSLAFDGMAYGETTDGNSEARDTLVVEAGGAEGIYIAAFDIGKIREYRKREVWGNTYRKPGKYAMLASEYIDEPFTGRRRRD